LAKLDLVQVLPDGRRLQYCEYGDPGGRTVVALHGTPGSRYKFAIADREAQRLGLRLISPDRWGYGLSDAPRGRPRLADYAYDIESLLGALGIERFGVVGVSGGGPYAAALASVLRARVSKLALVAPVAPLDLASRRHGVGWFHRFAFRALPRVPGGVSVVFSYFRGVLAVAPALAVRTMAARAGAPDRKLLAEPEISGDLVMTFKAGLARGVLGPAIDMACFSREWGLDLSSVSCRSRMWLGAMDRNVPLAAARKLPGDIPGLDVIEVEDAGHFWITRHYADVLAWLAGDPGAADRPSAAAMPGDDAGVNLPPTI